MIIKSIVNHRINFFGFLRYTCLSLYNLLPTLLYKSSENKIPICLVVGCGHTGTTLIAAKLGNHPMILAIGRETRFLQKGRTSAYEIRKIVDEWEYFAERDKKKLILEKTPKHIYSYKLIKKVIPNTKVVIMVRNPLDTIASLYKRFNNLDYCIERWIFDNNEAIKIRHNDNVIVIKYEDLTTQPEIVLTKVLNFINLEYTNKILDINDSVYGLVSQNYKNMVLRSQQVSGAIKSNQGTWRDVFTNKEIDYINKKTKNISEKLGYFDLSCAN